jgi:non-specific protein-tyrosine kinase
MTMKELQGETSSSVTPNTQLFNISVLDPSPTQAVSLANDIAATLIKQQLQQQQQNNKQAQQQIQQEITSTQQQINALTKQITNLQARPGTDAEITTLQGQVNALVQQLTQWQTLLGQLELAQAQGGDFLRVAQPAQMPDTPARPNVTLNTAIGLIAGLCLGLLLALLLEQLDTRVRSADALSQFLGWPVLATVWQSSPAKGEGGLLVKSQAQSANAEAFRILRTNVGFSALDKPLRMMLVTSATAHEGKSMTSANLALFFARAGKPTLLIDADLRRPTLHEKFQLSGDKMGLSNAVLASSQLRVSTGLLTQGTLPPLVLDPYIHTVDIPNLLIMPAGPLPPNPPELFDSQAMAHVLTAISQCGAEVVIFDTPPLLGLSDTRILAPKMDGVLVVCDITSANRKNLKQVRDLLTQTGAHVIGCVANKMRLKRKDVAYSYYSYGEQEDQQKKKEREKHNGHMVNAPAQAVPVFTPGPTSPSGWQ